MKLKAIVIKDAINGFGIPDFKVSEQAALRDFAYAVNQEKGLLQYKACDFSLYCVGDYDTETGEFVPCEKKLIVEAVSVLDKDVK